ncbi:type II toxin-antitoxin system RelE/ParE family toxin [Crassaminicella profunda]|uniref:type II toxin-antitoxin system RelE/ParE family toxin n=1 Tax=Crassaminicella profunda TaxID=1286698 RepID=UPI001CA727D8|nr:type II toxin-antitoxin system RelE/ParE family toxin [Crassaminicella profunda]QZY55569.1 type II toxin-antitoxin system RelE/ParE family toxin [Crassaminicella profunda]
MLENNYNIKFTPKANDDLKEIYSYISSKLFAQNEADNLLERMETSIMRLKELPFSCNFVADEYLKNKGYRKLMVDNYIVFYLVEEMEKKVIIIRVLYGRLILKHI